MMKKILPAAFTLFIALTNTAQAQKDTANTLLRFYEDNDFINLYMKGTDNAYTNGTRIDVFYEKKTKPRFFLNKALPKAGDSSINVYGWGITQLMYTPNNLATTAYQPNDYPYAGELYVSHSLYSYNPVKKYDFQTELIAGVRGPAAFTKQAQTYVHHLLNYQEPMGWDYQAKNSLLLNINFTVEKQLASYNGWMEVLGGAQASAGSMYNAIAPYAEIRTGKMLPYFHGLISQYSTTIHKHHKNSMQAYLFAKAQPTFIFSDRILQGKAPVSAQNTTESSDGPKAQPTPYHDINHYAYYFSYGAVLNTGHFSISVTETSNTALMKDLYSHEYGNISLYFSW